jgi:hypothetical protein
MSDRKLFAQNGFNQGFRMIEWHKEDSPEPRSQFLRSWSPANCRPFTKVSDEGFKRIRMIRLECAFGLKFLNPQLRSMPFVALFSARDLFRDGQR